MASPGPEPGADLREILRDTVRELLDDADLLLDQGAPVFGSGNGAAVCQGRPVAGGQAVAAMAEQIQQQEGVAVVVLGARGEESVAVRGRHGRRHRVQDEVIILLSI
jgi:hypothetical protein